MSSTSIVLSPSHQCLEAAAIPVLRQWSVMEEPFLDSHGYVTQSQPLSSRGDVHPLKGGSSLKPAHLILGQLPAESESGNKI